MSTHLTGRPRLNAILLPRPSIGAPMEVEWVDESITKVRRGGLVRVVEPRKRGRLRFGWTHLAPDLAAIVLGELQAPAVTLVPRTKADTDPAWAIEVALEVRVTSDLPSVQQLASGTVPLVVEVETLETYSIVPGTVYGGFYAEEIEGGIELTPYGQATLVPGADFVATFLGVTRSLATYDVGTAAVAALRTRPLVGAPVPTLLIDTTPAP